MGQLKSIRSVGATAIAGFLSSIRDFKVIIVLAVTGTFMLLSAWALANSAIMPPDGSSAALWHRGADGVLVAFAFGIAPIVVPLVPIVIGYDVLKTTRTRGFIETYMTRPVPRGGIALGMYLGTYMVVAISVLGLSASSLLVIQSITSSTLSVSLASAFLGSVLLLGALYLALIFVLGTVFKPSTMAIVYLALWFGFNLASGTAFTLSGQFLQILLIDEAQTFQMMWLDLASFTGIYQGLMASSVPEALGFIVWQNQSAGGVPIPLWLIPVAATSWLVGLLFLYGLMLSRYPLGD